MICGLLTRDVRVFVKPGTREVLGTIEETDGNKEVKFTPCPTSGGSTRDAGI